MKPIKPMLDIGTRVSHPGNSVWGPTTGTVTAQYWAGEQAIDNDTGKPYTVPHAVAVQVDKIPDGWPYPGTDLFAPDVDDLKLI